MVVALMFGLTVTLLIHVNSDMASLVVTHFNGIDRVVHVPWRYPKCTFPVESKVKLSRSEV